jgi:hypothetical protein
MAAWLSLYQAFFSSAESRTRADDKFIVLDGKKIITLSSRVGIGTSSSVVKTAYVATQPRTHYTNRPVTYRYPDGLIMPLV